MGIMFPFSFITIHLADASGLEVYHYTKLNWTSFFVTRSSCCIVRYRSYKKSAGYLSQGSLSAIFWITSPFKRQKKSVVLIGLVVVVSISVVNFLPNTGWVLSVLQNNIT